MRQSDAKVIFLGPFYTFSHAAAISLFPKAQFFYDLNPKTIFKKVESGEMDYGILPVENSATGVIPEFYPLLLDQDFQLFSKEIRVRVVKELYLPICHHLLARSELPLAEIKTLYTHRQPYLQCVDWVGDQMPGVHVEFTDSTATAAEKLAQDAKGACIGGDLLAKEKKLLTLRGNIQDFSMNVTRFFAITAVHARIPPRSDKTTFSVIIPDRVGTLVEVLQLVASRGINLGNIKALPVRAANVFREEFKDWFNIDVGVSAHSAAFQNLLSEFDERRNLVLAYKVLGSYRNTLPTELARRKAGDRGKRVAGDQDITWEELIKSGESESVEFKSTLRYDLKTKQVNKDLAKVVAKTLAGFMNCDGGYLFIGVSDDGEMLGIDADISVLKKKSRDGFLAALYQVVSDMIGKEFCQFIHPDFFEASGKTVCCIRVDVSTKAAWIADAGTHVLFVRAGNSTRPLDPKEANEYILSRFRST